MPQRELRFLHDQRTMRQMKIAGVDINVTKKIKKSNARKQAFNKQQMKEKKELTQQQHKDNLTKNYWIMRVVIPEFFVVSVASEINCGDKEIERCERDTDDESTNSLCNAQMRVPLPNLAKEADRYGVSDRVQYHILQEMHTLHIQKISF